MNFPKNHYIKVIIFIIYCFSPLRNLHAQLHNHKTDSLIASLDLAKSDSDKVNLLLDISSSLKYIDSAGQINYASRALELAKTIKWDAGIKKAARRMGKFFSGIPDYVNAIKYYNFYLSLSCATDDSLNQATAMVFLAEVYSRLAQYNKAIAYYRTAIAIKTNPDVERGILANVGGVYNILGDYTDALASYESSLKINEEFIKTKKNRDIVDTLQTGGLLITIGDIYLAMSLYDKALDNYYNALKLSEHTNNRGANVARLRVYALVAIGKTFQFKKDYSQSIENYNKALEVCREIDDTRDEADIYNQLANTYLGAGNNEEAIEYAQKSLKLVEENKYYEQLSTTYITMGKVLTAQKDYNKAVTYLTNAVSMCGKSSSLTGEKDAWEALSHTYEQMNKPALALDAYKHFIAIRDSVYNINKANELTSMDLQTGYSRDSLKHADEYHLKMQKQRVLIYGGYAGLLVVVLLAFFIYRNYSQQRKANAIIHKAHETIKQEKQLSENLLLNILPEEVAKELKTQGIVEAKLFDHVTVLFTDFVNFTEAGERYTPQELVAELHTCFKAFDGIIGKYGIEKIKTVGDAYLAVSGLPQPAANHASEIVKAAIDILNFMTARKKQMGDKTFDIRIGINSGTVVAGIVGVKKFAYDIWGDTVNTAARMEQYSEPGKINISQLTYDLVKDEFMCEDRGEIDAKHKGKMRMYFISSAVAFSA